MKYTPGKNFGQRRTRAESYDENWVPPPPALHWGMYRATPSDWSHPAAVVPPGSKLVAGSFPSRMASPFVADPSVPGGYMASFSVPGSFAPCTLALLPVLANGVLDPPKSSRFAATWVGMTTGNPDRLGAHVVARYKDDRGVDRVDISFAVVARHAQSVSICLQRFDPAARRTGKVTGNPHPHPHPHPGSRTLPRSS